MTRAWYGVTPTGAQAGFAIDSLVSRFGEEYPEAVNPLDKCRYVDDIAAGSATEQGREEQIHQSTLVLAKGGFKFKFIVRSGQKPPEQASSDGETLKMLGYKWNPSIDMYSPGLGELNFNRKKRGLKDPNLFSVETRDDAKKLLQSVIITRKIVVAKVAEFYDPVGLFEPIKLQMKLELSELNNTDWEEPLRMLDQELWKERFINYIDYPTMQARRSVVDLLHGDKLIRLIGFSDAAAHAGGAVIYAGTEQTDGNYSCTMLVSKSRLMKGTIQRNELSALMLLTELAFIAKRAIGDRVQEIIYLTDSTITLAWCQSSGRRLRLFVNNRVETVKRMIQWTLDSEDGDKLPLYHVDGTENIADLLTKKHDISQNQVSIGSSWEKGLDWMKLPIENMPIKRYEDMQVNKDDDSEVKQECFDEPFLLSQGLESSLHMIQDEDGELE